MSILFVLYFVVSEAFRKLQVRLSLRDLVEANYRILAGLSRLPRILDLLTV